MTMLPGGYAYKLMAAEREREEARTRRSRAARFALECCRVSTSLFSRLTRMIGLPARPAPVPTGPTSCTCS